MTKVVTFFETWCRFDFWEFGKIRGTGRAGQWGQL